MKSTQSGAAIAFEVMRNGRRLCVAGLRGNAGVVAVIVNSRKGEGDDEIVLDAGGLDSKTQEHITWVQRPLEIGDELLIRVVDSTRTTRARKRWSAAAELDKKHEIAWLRKTAAKHGFKVVRG